MYLLRNQELLAPGRNLQTILLELYEKFFIRFRKRIIEFIYIVK